MHRLVGLLLALLLTTPTFAFDVPGLLEQLQQHRLSECPPVAAGSRAAQSLTAEFAQLVAVTPLAAGTPLRVSECQVIAQVRAGTVVVSVDLAGYKESERMFVMAHELGHIVHKDWAAQVTAYTAYAGNATTLDEVIAVMNQVMPQMNAMSRAAEFKADEFALGVTAAAGYPRTDGAIALLRRFRNQPAGASHPSAYERLERIRQAQ